MEWLKKGQKAKEEPNEDEQLSTEPKVDGNAEAETQTDLSMTATRGITCDGHYCHITKQVDHPPRVGKRQSNHKWCTKCLLFKRTRTMVEAAEKLLRYSPIGQLRYSHIAGGCNTAILGGCMSHSGKA